MRIFGFGIWMMVWGLPAVAEVPKVVVDIAPVHSLVAMVMGDVGAPVLLLPKGADAHDFQLRPSQAADLDAADVVIWVGPEMSPWLERSLRGLGRDGGLALLDAPETETRGYEDEAEAGHDHAQKDAHDHKDEHAHDEHAHDDAHGHDDEHGHAHDGVDPHAWLDPENARIWLGLIAEALAVADPDSAALYRANAEAARGEVSRIEAEVVAVLAPVANKPFVVMHDAYGYFAGHFGLQIVGSLRPGDAALPGAAHLVELQDKVAASAAVCLFREANHDTASAEQMAEATGLRLGPSLDPEGSSLEPGPGLYGALMLGLGNGVAGCLSGS